MWTKPNVVVHLDALSQSAAAVSSLRAGRPTAQEREGEVSSILDGTIQTTRRDGSVVTDARVGTRPVQ